MTNHKVSFCLSMTLNMIKYMNIYLMLWKKDGYGIAIKCQFEKKENVAC